MAEKPLIPYIRQSRKKEKTISLDSQREKIEAWTQFEGETLAPEVLEQGVSGSKHWKKRGIGEAIAAVERGQASGIVVAYQSRLTRESGLGTAEVYEALKAAGARLVCVNESIDTSKGNPDDTEMMFTINAAIARREWARARTNYGEGAAKAKERGIEVNGTPVGFERRDGLKRGQAEGVRPQDKDGRLVKNGDVVAVEQAFRVRAGGGSWSETARLLEQAGVLTPTGAARWSTNSVRSMIARPIYKGWIGQHHFAEYEVVPPDVWAAAQSKPNPRDEDGKLARNGRQDGGKRLLGGLVFCAGCGYRMAPTSSTGKSVTYRYYECKNRCDAHARVRAEGVEALAEADFLGALAYAPVAHAPDLTPVESAVAVAAEAVKKWEDARDDGQFDPADCLRGLEKARERLTDTEQALWQAREDAGLNDERLTLAERWPDLDTEEKRRTMIRFGAKVIVQRKRGWVEVPGDIGRGGVEMSERTQRKETLRDRAFLTFEAEPYREAATSRDFEPEIVVEGVPGGEGTVDWDNPDPETLVA